MIGRTKKEGPVARYDVSHPEYGTISVDAISLETAINAAIKRWDGSWKKDAGYCHAVWVGAALRLRCKRCHGEYGEPGDPGAYSPQGGRPIRSAPLSRTAGLCPACLEAVDRQRREAERHVRWARAREKRLKEMDEMGPPQN